MRENEKKAWVTILAILIALGLQRVAFAQAKESQQINPVSQKDTINLINDVIKDKNKDKVKISVKENKLPQQPTQVKVDNPGIKAESKIKSIQTNEERLRNQLEEIIKELNLKTDELKQKQAELTNFEKLSKNMNDERLILKKTLEKEREKSKESIEKLQDKVYTLSNKRDLEMAQLYEKLGTAYVQAKLYEDAITAYTKSLKINRKNAQVHYDLGLLYKHSLNNNSKAIYHFKQYLWIKPDAPNRKDIEYLINMLESSNPILQEPFR
ncbi:MAG: tetratricopeptide repeat protein [Candidatus Omnitrophica bacterium]|nr:tetratricopeptide repeat protein [Candidatus Omnitrophota bacterium]